MTENHARWHDRALACVQIVALMLLAPPTATAEVAVGPTKDLPWSQVDFQAGAVAVLANGSFAITTLRTDADLNPHQVQFFNAAGDLVRTRLLRNPSNLVSEDVGVGSLGGSYLVVWQDFRFDGGIAYAHAFAQLYSEKGMPLGTQFLWPSSAIPNFANFYRFGSAPRWLFLPITYELLPDQCFNNPLYQILLRVAEPNPIPQLPPIRIGPPVVSNIEDAAVNGSGRFVVDAFSCSSSQCDSGSQCVRGIQIFDAERRPITPFVTAAVTQTEVQAVVAINARGQVLLQYYSSGRNLVRLYEENGSPASHEVPLRMGDLYESGIGIKGLDDGTFVLAWLASDPTGPYGPHGTAFVIDRFDPRTNRFEAPVAIASAFQFRNAAMTLGGNGRGVVVWQSQDADFQFAGHLASINITP